MFVASSLVQSTTTSFYNLSGITTRTVIRSGPASPAFLREVCIVDTRLPEVGLAMMPACDVDPGGRQGEMDVAPGRMHGVPDLVPVIRVQSGAAQTGRKRVGRDRKRRPGRKAAQGARNFEKSLRLDCLSGFALT